MCCQHTEAALCWHRLLRGCHQTAGQMLQGHASTALTPCTAALHSSTCSCSARHTNAAEHGGPIAGWPSPPAAACKPQRQSRCAFRPLYPVSAPLSLSATTKSSAPGAERRPGTPCIALNLWQLCQATNLRGCQSTQSTNRSCKHTSARQLARQKQGLLLSLLASASAQTSRRSASPNDRWRQHEGQSYPACDL